MSPPRAALDRALERGEQEGGSVEFKERLTRDTHLAGGRRESLAAQLRHRVLSGDGEATYVVGVTDEGGIAGIAHDAFSESMDVLSLLAEEADCHIDEVQTWGVPLEGSARERNDDRDPRSDEGGARSDESGTRGGEAGARNDESGTRSGRAGARNGSGDAGSGGTAGRADTSGLVGLATVREGAMLETDDEHIVVGTAGHVDHGKSTLVGTLVTGQPDDGEGGTRRYLDVQPHEVERGLSADLSYGVYGFDDDGPVRMDNPNRKTDRARVVEEAERLVSFVDTVGHEPWLRTTIRGLVGQKLDYGLLTVAADDGPTRTTREHLGVLLATDLPTIVAITKADLVDEDRLREVEREVERLLRDADRTPLLVRRHGVDAALEEIDETVVPIVATSAVSMDGTAVLDELFERLPKTNANAQRDDFRMYVDRTYSVTGVGAVASGTITSGTVETGDELLLGPMPDGAFREVEVRSIEMHYHRVDSAQAGRIVGIALKGVEEAEIDRGMVLLPRRANPDPVREFEAELMVLNHPTRIDAGYEPVVHVETISEAAAIHPDDGPLLPGDTGRATLRFKFQPYLLEAGQRFVFREGRSKGVGTVTEVEPDE